MNEKRGTFGYIAHNKKDDEIILAFRGSSNFDNWVTNLKFDKVKYKDVPKAEVHYGFNQAYEEVAGQVISTIKQYLAAHPSATLLFTGHSLGAALVTLAALDIKRQLNPQRVIKFYTFGCPRVGNQALTDYILTLFPQGLYSRVTHYNDIVPHIPPSVVGYNHAGNEVWYMNKGADLTHKECENASGSKENNQCSDSLTLTTGIDAHLLYLGLPISDLCLAKDASNDGLERYFQGEEDLDEADRKFIQDNMGFLQSQQEADEILQ